MPCRRRLQPGGILPFAAPVYYAFHHSGTGRALVHRLKYQGLARAGDVLATAMRPLVPPGVAAIVPVPRATIRRVVHGVDPAWEIAWRLGRMTNIPVRRALRAPVWWPRHTGQNRARRSPPPFRARGRVAGPLVLVDDVVTSGATLRGALGALDADVAAMLAATSPGMMYVAKAPTASGRLRGSTAAWR